MLKTNLKRAFAVTALAALIGVSGLAQARTVIDEKGNTEELLKLAPDVALHISNANNLYKIDGGKSIIGDWILKAGVEKLLNDPT